MWPSFVTFVKEVINCRGMSVCLSVQHYSLSYGQVAMKFWKRVVLGTGNDYLDVSGSREPI